MATKTRSLGTLAVAASAVALPMGDRAQAADVTMPVKAVPLPPAWVPHWTFSAEGGLLISNFSRTAFPNGLLQDKLGADALPELCSLTNIECSSKGSGSLAPGRNIGWYGALSIGRDIDPVWDWRLSGSFNSFFPNRRSAALNEVALTRPDDNSTSILGTGSRLVTESDRFRFIALDFDLGRKWEQGLLHLRTFAGARALLTDDLFNVSDAQAKGLIVGGTDSLFTSQANAFTQTEGRSHFFGIGPRVGVEGFYGTNWGVAGSASAAILPGWRYSTFDQASSSSFSATICDTSVTPTSCVGPFTFNQANAANAHHSKFTAVGDLAASLGLAWRPTPIVGVEAGYRVEALLNARDSFGFANAVSLSGHFDDKRDVIMHGPYVKAVIRY